MCKQFAANEKRPDTVALDDLSDLLHAFHLILPEFILFLGCGMRNPSHLPLSQIASLASPLTDNVAASCIPQKEPKILLSGRWWGRATQANLRYYFAAASRSRNLKA
jgi:hypothetical protein